MTVQLTAAELAIIMVALEFYNDESPEAEEIDAKTWNDLNEKFDEALAI